MGGFGLCFLYLRNVLGYGWNHKRVYRIYCELELNLRIKPRKRLKRDKPDELAVPEAPNQVWSMDFMADRLGGGRAFRLLNLLDDFNREGLGAAKVRLRDVVNSGSTTIDYLYDFGDSWEHRLTVTNIRQGDPDRSYPRYVGGERSAPPEDCGGLPGFYEILTAIADPGHPDHTEMLDWFDDYDPDTFDDLPIKYALGRIANQRNAAKVRLAKKKATPSPD